MTLGVLVANGAGDGAGAGVGARHSASSAASVVATPLNGTPSAAASARTSLLIVLVRGMSTATISASVRALSVPCALKFRDMSMQACVVLLVL
jgi:hypothetical protein